MAAHTPYAVAYLWAFVFQGTYLMLDALGGGADPAFDTADFPLAYGLGALAIFVVGFGLVELGHRVGRGRRGRRASRGPAVGATRAGAIPQSS